MTASKLRQAPFRTASLILLFLLPSSVLCQPRGDPAASYAIRGQRALASGDFKSAKEDFDELAKLQPEVAEVHATLGIINFKLRNFEEAADQVRAAQKLKPSLPRLDSLLGLALSETGHFTDALPGLERGFKQTADLEIRRMCGLQLLRAYTGLHRDADAVEVALNLVRKFPDDPEILYHTGRVFGNYAYVVMERLHDNAPNSVWMLQAQGEANESQKNYESAVMSYRHVLELEPGRSGIHYRLGRIHLAEFRTSQKPEDRRAAKQEFEGELHSNPGNGNARYELALIAAEDNDLDQARMQFEEALNRSPDFEPALVGLAGIFLQRHRGAEAVNLLRRATRIDPNDEVAWYRLAQAEKEAGDRVEAQKALDQFRSLHAHSSESQLSATSEITPQKLDSAPQP